MDLNSLVEKDKSQHQEFSSDDIRIDCLDHIVDNYRSLTGKQVRSQCVQIGFMLGHLPRERDLASSSQTLVLDTLKSAIEDIHLGSLIVDDIEDQSEERRGEAALYKRIGVGRALNVGNYLYFSALEGLDRLDLPSETLSQVYSLYFKVMKEAHEGQAADLCYRMLEVDQKKQISISEFSLQRKTGALLALAFGWGAVANYAHSHQVKKVMELGRAVGVTLQMFDDIGNLDVEHSGKKHLEDLIQQKPSFVWQIYTRILSPKDQSIFIAAITRLSADPSDENRKQLIQFLHEKEFSQKARAYAHQSLIKNLDEFESNFGSLEYPKSHRWILALLERIKVSYGK